MSSLACGQDWHFQASHFVHVPGFAQPKRWGLLDRVISSNCPPVRSLCVDLGPFSLAGRHPPLDGVDTAYGPRRTMLNKILVDAAVNAGVELREKFYDGGGFDRDGRVTGIRGRPGNGTSVHERAGSSSELTVCTRWSPAR
jgi:hypothetical protein